VPLRRPGTLVHDAPRQRASRGVTLIEVLVTMVILSVGLLGIAGLQLKGMQANRGAFYTSQAAFLATDVLDRMRTNRPTALSTGAYARNFGDTPPTGSDCRTTDCDADQLARYDLRQWVNAVAAALPEGDAEISFADVGDTRVYAVDIRWRDTYGAATGQDLQHLIYRAEP
jgi:type IV pilus assembly protein PilV